MDLSKIHERISKVSFTPEIFGGSRYLTCLCARQVCLETDFSILEHEPVMVLKTVLARVKTQMASVCGPFESNATKKKKRGYRSPWFPWLIQRKRGKKEKESLMALLSVAGQPLQQQAQTFSRRGVKYIYIYIEKVKIGFKNNNSNNSFENTITKKEVCKPIMAKNDLLYIHTIFACIKEKKNQYIYYMYMFKKMKSFAGAYSMLSDLEKLKLTPTASMYNAIMGGYFREKIDKGLYVFKQMEEANLKPDSKTFSYLITNCDSEEVMIKYYEEMKRSGVPVTKNVYMALINAYASCGQFEKAKHVLTDEGIPAKSVSEIKSVLIQALASRRQFSDALNMYKEIKQEHYQSDEGANTMLELLEEIDDPEYWFDGCCRVILYCVRHKHLSPAVDLLKQLNDKCHTYELALEPFLDEVFSLIGDLEPTHLQTGIDLLRIVKNEFGITPPRKSLDFLLHACVNAKSLQNAQIVWKEYQAAGLPHNILNFLRMYQALLTAGDHKAAKILLTKIPKDDPHVRCVIHACQATYMDSTYKNMKKKKLKK
ncbi:hypothetical protein UlMin_043971 [Ulmus minor]